MDCPVSLPLQPKLGGQTLFSGRLRISLHKSPGFPFHAHTITGMRQFSRQSFRLCSQGLRPVLTCILLMILSVLLTGPDWSAGENESTTRTNISLLDSRRGFATKLNRKRAD